MKKFYELGKNTLYPICRSLTGNGNRKTLEIIKKITCPYYLGVHKIRGKKGAPFIRVYDHKTAMMITLHGNLREYLDSKND